MKHFSNGGWRILMTLALVFTLLGQPLYASAEQQGKRLPAEQGEVLDLSLYTWFGKKIDKPVIFRSNGEFVWQWMNRSAAASILYSDGKGGYLYSNYGESPIFSVNQQGYRQWMSEPFDLDIGTIQTASNGNKIIFGNDSDYSFNKVIILNGNGDTIRVIDSPYVTFAWLEFFQLWMQTGLIMTSGQDGFYAYDENGNLMWKYPLESVIESAGAGPDGDITLITEQEYIILDSQGRLQSEEPIIHETIRVGNIYYEVIRDANQRYFWSGERITKDEFLERVNKKQESGPVVEYQEIKWEGGKYYSFYKNQLFAEDLQGNLLWTYEMRSGTYPSDLVCDKEGNLFFSDNAGNIYALDPNGNERFRLIRDNTNLTLTELQVTDNGDLIGTTEDIGLFYIGKPRIDVYYEGERLEFDKQPVIQQGTTLVPFRALFERLGLVVEWDAATKTVTGTKKDVRIQLRIGEAIAQVNEENKPLSVAPQNIDGTTYVPLRFVGEALGKEVEWDGRNRQIRIGEIEQLAEDAVKRFLMHLEQQDEAQATHDLSDNSHSVTEQAPNLAPYFIIEYWYTKILSMETKLEDDGTVMVYTEQENWRYENHAIEKYWYRVKRGSDDLWKIEDSNLFHGTAVAKTAALITT